MWVFYNTHILNLGVLQHPYSDMVGYFTIPMCFTTPIPAKSNLICKDIKGLNTLSLATTYSTLV